jgi:hypothetical protein
MSSVDGRSARQSKRYSVTALYLSMSANERDMEIEDDLARGKSECFEDSSRELTLTATRSAENSTGSEDEDIRAVEEELCP